eukprot:TRINITY_DN90853_c0_g1_i1.p1 TRINITY_DN90853_c0_g1~~TRINITY_DN90853_c0_g1_i1.p1  ORF type:complete len:449 (-),score=61.45 TRINITY_DN90853_c0_g1_i1:144-1427(-)
MGQFSSCEPDACCYRSQQFTPGPDPPKDAHNLSLARRGPKAQLDTQVINDEHDSSPKLELEEEVEDVAVVQPCLSLEVHSAKLLRSFCKLGKLSPWVVVRVGGTEVHSSEPHKNGQREPVWDVKLTLDPLPEQIDVAVWGKNTMRRNVFCGSVTIPISSNMPRIERQEFVLEKKAATTGTLCVTLDLMDGLVGLQEVADGPAPLDPQPWRLERARSSQSSLLSQSVGGEFDELVESVCGTPAKPGDRKLSIRLSTHDITIAEGDEDDAADDNLKQELPRLASTPTAAFAPQPLVGSWKCVHTHGLEDFMIKSGIGMFQRKIAMAASWPSWEFAAKGDTLLFVNHSAIGDIREEIPLDKEYDWKDGKGNPWKCKASWQKTLEGGTLLIQRHGPLGNYTEERKVCEDKLEFILTNPGYNASWGRTFKQE